MTQSVDIEQLLDEIEHGKKPKHRPPPPEPDRAGEALWSWDHIVILAAITLLAGVLRLYKLGEWSFWIDEVHTLRDAILVTPEEFWDGPRARYPLGFYLLRLIQPYLPSSGEGFYRLPFAFFGIASVPMLGVVARRMVGVGPALLAALLLALSPWHLFWSQSCRFYTLVMFLGLCSVGCFWHGLERGSRMWLVSALFFGALAALSHPSAAFIVAGMIVYLLVLRTRWFVWPEATSKKQLLWFLIPVVVGAVVAVPNLWHAFSSFQSSKPTPSVTHLANTMAWFLRVPVVIAAFGGVLLLWRLSRRSTLFCACMILVPSLGVGLVSLRAQTSAQYLFFTLPFWCVFAAYGAWELVSRTSFAGNRAMLARALVFGLVLLDSTAQDHFYFHYRHGDRPKWRSAAEWIQRNGTPEDFVASTNEPSLEWYLNPVRPLQETYVGTGAKKKVVQLLASWTLDDLEKWKKNADKERTRVWIVLTEPMLEGLARGRRKFEERNSWIREHCRQVLRLQNWVGPKDMTIFVYLYDPIAELEKLDLDEERLDEAVRARKAAKAIEEARRRDAAREGKQDANGAKTPGKPR